MFIKNTKLYKIKITSKIFEQNQHLKNIRLAYPFRPTVKFKTTF